MDKQHRFYAKWGIDIPLHLVVGGYVPRVAGGGSSQKYLPVLKLRDFPRIPEIGTPIFVHVKDEARQAYSYRNGQAPHDFVRATNPPIAVSGTPSTRTVVRVYPWTGYDGRKLPPLKVVVAPMRHTSMGGSTSSRIVEGQVIAEGFALSATEAHGFLAFVVLGDASLIVNRVSNVGNPSTEVIAI